MGEDLLQLIFAAALILFGLLGGRKKKKPTTRPQAQTRRPPAPRPPARRAPAPAPAPRPQPRPAESNPYQSTLDALEQILSGRAPAPPSPPPPQTVPDPTEAISLERTDVEEASSRWEAGLDRGMESLETLEGAGEKSHAAFHARYPDRPASPPAAAATPRGIVGKPNIRDAIVWSEILGPPVSLRDT